MKEAHFLKDMQYFTIKKNMVKYILQCSITLIEKIKIILEDLESSIQTFQNLEQWLMSLDIRWNLLKTSVSGKLNSEIFTILHS